MAIGIGIKAKKNIVNIWLVAFFISTAVVITVKILYNTGNIIYYPHWFKINYPVGILRPVFIYLYAHYLLKGIQKIRWKDLVHFIPFFVLLAYLSPFLLQSAEYKLAVLNREIVNTLGLIPGWYVYFQFAYSIIYIIAVYFGLNKYIKDNPSPTKSQKNLIHWIRMLFVGGLLFLLLVIVLRVLGLSGNFNYLMYELFSILLIFFCIIMISLPELISTNPNLLNKYNNSSLTDKEISSYFSKIEKLMNEKEFFKREDLKLKHIAVELQLPEYLISQIINQKAERSFRSFINAYRIKEAKKMLLGSRQQYSIEGIAREVGFSNRSSFYNAFKKETKLTPTQFLKKNS